MINKKINEVEIVPNRNCVYQTAYHVVWCPKYRKQIFTGSIAERTTTLIDTICKENNWTVIAKEIQPDHIHLFNATLSVVSMLQGDDECNVPSQ